MGWWMTGLGRRMVLLNTSPYSPKRLDNYATTRPSNALPLDPVILLGTPPKLLAAVHRKPPRILRFERV